MAVVRQRVVTNLLAQLRKGGVKCNLSSDALVTFLFMRTKKVLTQPRAGFLFAITQSRIESSSVGPGAGNVTSTLDRAASARRMRRFQFQMSQVQVFFNFADIPRRFNSPDGATYEYFQHYSGSSIDFDLAR